MRVVIGDDSLVYRQRFTRLAQEAGYEVVGTAQSALETLEMCCRLNPDLAIVDVIMPPGSGQTVALKLASEKTVPRILVATNNSQESRWTLFHEAGIATFTKPGSDAQFLAKLKALNDGDD